tara:strand:- start:213 stop:353 length:141 start_codon:yes stop_codon:yes gene_type:complete
MPHPMKKKKKDWFDEHIEIIGLDEESNQAVKKKLKEDLDAKIKPRG